MPVFFIIVVIIAAVIVLVVMSRKKAAQMKEMEEAIDETALTVLNVQQDAENIVSKIQNTKTTFVSLKAKELMEQAVAQIAKLPSLDKIVIPAAPDTKSLAAYIKALNDAQQAENDMNALKKEIDSANDLYEQAMREETELSRLHKEANDTVTEAKNTANNTVAETAKAEKAGYESPKAKEAVLNSVNAAKNVKDIAAEAVKSGEAALKAVSIQEAQTIVSQARNLLEKAKAGAKMAREAATTAAAEEEKYKIDAQYQSALSYKTGDGVQKDMNLAFAGFKAPAEQGHADALYELGLCYLNGDGTQKDIFQALDCFRQSAAKGHQQAKTAYENERKKIKSKYNDIFEAMKNGTLDDVKSFIYEKGLNVNSANDNGDNMLHLAVSAGKLDVVKYLVSWGVKINAQNKAGGTPLYTAIFQTVLSGGKINNLPVIEYLVSAGADVNIVYPDGQTLLLAVLKLDVDAAIIKLLVNNGADVDKTDNINQSALHRTAEYIDLDNETAKLIVSKSKKVDQQDDHGNTPMHQACMVGNVEMLKLLLAHGANINKQSNNKSTPLHMAVASSQIECVKYLISKKANVNATGEDDWTPLHWAAQAGNVDIARLLVDGGADTSARTYRGSTALMMAKQFGHYSLDSYLSSKTYY
jgi:ankyrin repeat protein